MLQRIEAWGGGKHPAGKNTLFGAALPGFINLHKSRVLWPLIGRRGDTSPYPDVNDAKAHRLVHIQLILAQPLGDFIQHPDHYLARCLARQRNPDGHGHSRRGRGCHRHGGRRIHCGRVSIRRFRICSCNGIAHRRINGALLVQYRAWPEQNQPKRHQPHKQGCQDVGCPSAHPKFHCAAASPLGLSPDL
jgi:hypothetical protein